MNQLFAPAAALVLWQSAACAAPWSRAAEEENIRVATFRFQLNPYHVGPKPKKSAPMIPAPKGSNGEVYVYPVKAYFFEVEGKDPSDSLMKWFAGSNPPIKKVSRSYIISPEDKKEWERNSFYWVRDKQTKDIGLVYSLGRIQWLSRSRIMVEAGYFGGGLNAGRNTYTFRLQSGHWKVTHIEYGPVA